MTQAKQIINLLLLGNFYPVMYRSIQKRKRILIYGLVARYGPQTNYQRKRLIEIFDASIEMNEDS